MNSQRILYFGLSAIILIILGFHIYEYRFVCDDAFISFRYAVNFSDGHGLVFNIGEQVEGYTNFLWVIILSGVDALGLEPHLSAMPLNIIITGILFIVIIYFNRKLFGRGKYDYFLLIAPALLVLNRSFAVWSTGGLETRLFTLFLFVAIINLILTDNERRRLYLSSLFFILAALTRPEGILLFGSFWFFFYLFNLKKRVTSSALIIPAVVFIICIGGHFLFRYLYYGYPFPNTYYAKVTGSWFDMGIVYLVFFILEYGLYLFIPAMILLFTRFYNRRYKKSIMLIMISFIPYFIYLASLGGDHFEFRQLDIFIPWMAIIIQEAIRAVHTYLMAKNFRPLGIVLTCFFVLTLMAYTVPGLVSHRNFQTVYDSALGINSTTNNFLARIPVIRQYFELIDYLHGKLAASFICIRQEEHKMAMDQIFYPQAQSLKKAVDLGIIEKNESICLACVGAIPYFSNLTTIDKLGLTDKYVAHKEIIHHPDISRIMAHEKKADLNYLERRGVTYIATTASRFFFPREELIVGDRFIPDKVRRGSYIIPVENELFVFMSVFPPKILGPRINQRHLEFFYYVSEDTVFRSAP